MARTKATVGAKVSSVKSSKARAAAPPPPSPRTESSGFRSSLAGCNAVCPRETPAWQLPITRFFATDKTQADDSAGPSKPRRPVIQSDDEDTPLDRSTDLPPLHGDDSHKIAEYFPRQDRGEDKENVAVHAGARKRSLDAEQTSASKRVKV